MRIVALFQKKWTKYLGPIWNNFHVFKPVYGDDPEQNAGTIHASNPEHLPVCKAPHEEDPEKNAETIHTSNTEHLLVFKALG